MVWFLDQGDELVGVPMLRRYGMLWSLLSTAGVVLAVMGPIERAVSRFEVLEVGTRVDVTLPLSDRSPAHITLSFTTRGRVPLSRVDIFSSVARDVAWEVRSAGGLVVALDSTGLWLGAKDEWVRLSGRLPKSTYELEVSGDRSAVLTSWSSGSRAVVGRLAPGAVPLFEVTGLHARGAGLVTWGKLRVVSSPSEYHRISVWILLGYLLVAVSVGGVLLPELRSLRGLSVRSRVHDFLGWCRAVWWFWLAVAMSIVLTPPDHGESWIIGMTRVGSWVTINPLTDVVPNPFGGLYTFLLSLWSKSVTPVWLLRLPTAAVFVVAATCFSQRFIVDHHGERPHKRVVTQSLVILLIYVMGLDGEWLRPEIPVLSFWMLAVSVLVGISPDSDRNQTRIHIAGLLAGLALTHPLGIPAAMSIAVFCAYQLWRVRNSATRVTPLWTACITGSYLAVIGGIFGHNLESFLEARASLQINSPRHSLSLDLRPRLEDLSYSNFLFRLSLPLVIASLTLLLAMLVSRRLRISGITSIRLIVTLLMSLSIVMPAGPWGIYFFYLAPLAIVSTVALPATTGSMATRVLSSMFLLGALTFVGLSRDLNYRFLLAPIVASVLIGVALLISRPLSLGIVVTLLVGVGLNHLPHRVNERFSDVPLLNKPSSLTGPIETQSEFMFQETEISVGRILGFGPRCGFISLMLHESKSLASVRSPRVAHVAHRYGLLSPCTKPPNNSPNLEGVAEIVHNEAIDMLFFRRVLTSFLENNSRDVSVFCLSASGVDESRVDVGTALRLNRPNCLIRTEQFPMVQPASTSWGDS